MYHYGDPQAWLCVDPSTTIDSKDKGNMNRFIPDPGIDEDANPKVYYSAALIRVLVWLWNLRISYPHKDIMQTVDNISAAFHRILYNPAMAIAFASL